MRKKDRQELIKQILQNEEIYRQEDLVKRLDEQGIYVTQATISRDVKEMQLVKIPQDDGGYIYNVPTEKSNQLSLEKILSDSFVSCDTHNEMCFVKVLPGNGPILSSMIEQNKFEEVFATLCDDNSVMIFAKSAQAAQQLAKTFYSWVKLD
ncbi:ArgR family transcriptional regulator [Ligilactobacillus equi]|uniref:Arginine repressor n=1 Tax=Ligilactobacillus equi DPC 6820 TaxID=1392007 RepID=V7HY66_9LACO|nr:arginine repressor [Ligilactobacillus equi]ETA74822.1 arginine repressor [Ligilactobacillus equi DPC 6820]MCQ2556589.1 ArgR family transcriptional regulator [Ligilactobacillus sp.]